MSLYFSCRSYCVALLFFVWAVVTCCIPAGLFCSSAFRYTSASMQPDPFMFVAAILASSLILCAAYRSLSWEIRNRDPTIIRALCGGGSSGRPEVARQAAFRDTSCYSVFVTNACYFTVYGACYHLLPKGLVTSVSYAMCSIFSSCIVQMSAAGLAAMYPAGKGLFLRGRGHGRG